CASDPAGPSPPAPPSRRASALPRTHPAGTTAPLPGAASTRCAAHPACASPRYQACTAPTARSIPRPPPTPPPPPPSSRPPPSPPHALHAPPTLVPSFLTPRRASCSLPGRFPVSVWSPDRSANAHADFFCFAATFAAVIPSGPAPFSFDPNPPPTNSQLT